MIGRAGASLALNRLREEPTEVVLHIGNPGVDGQRNKARENRRLPVDFGPPTGYTMASPPVVWKSVAATETYTDFAVWSGVSFLGAGELDTAVAADAGDDVTIDFIWRLD